MSKSTLIIILGITNAVTLIMLLVFAVTCEPKRDTYVYPATNVEVSTPKKGFFEEEYVEVGDKILINDNRFNIKPGYTYYLDKGSMMLYADIIKINDNNIFVYAKEFHQNMEMADAAVSDIFTYDATDHLYHNNDNSVEISYIGSSAEFKDNRNISLQFNGLLSQIPDNKHKTNTTVSLEKEVEASTEEIEEEDKDEEEVDETNIIDGVIVDEYYSATPVYDGMVANNNLKNFLSSDYEQTKFIITAKYIESSDFSGTKYVDIHSGTEFYAFGSGFPYNPLNCNTVTITATYRGNEQHFNGLEMDSTYPCFVVDSIRKPTNSEVKGG